MNVRLLHRDRDLDLEALPPAHEEDLVQDLELERLFAAMAAEDPFLHDVARRVLLSSLTAPEEIVHRQDVLRDCLARPDVVRELYAVAVEAIAAERGVHRGLLRDSPESTLRRSREVLALFLGSLRRLRAVADAHAPAFASEGFTRLFRTLAAEFDDEYLARAAALLSELELERGALFSARLGPGNRGVQLVLRRSHARRWWERIRTPPHRLQIADRDEAGHRALAELRGRGLASAADALARAAGDLLAFFHLLRAELGFYVGALNLHARLTGPVCFPDALAAGSSLQARGLYDVCLGLATGAPVVANDVDADGASLVMITGANQGGKSTFLRSVGVAQLMLQSGMFAGAEALRADVRDGVFTHFRREEDATLRSGKLDEELARMSALVDALGPRALVLCNESFASTNEREGSQIAREILRALRERGIKVVFVTHLFDLAGSLHARCEAGALFLRADRRRTFRVAPGAPEPTSHGADLYRRVFGVTPGGEPATGAARAARR